MSRYGRLKLTIVLLVAASGVLVAIGAWASYQRRKPPYRFIGCPSHLRRFVGDSSAREECSCFYSFPADFNFVCAEAVVELGSAGKKCTGWDDGKTMSLWTFFTDATERMNTDKKFMIQIIDGFVLSDEPLSYNDYRWVAAPGWVTVGLYRDDRKRDIWQMIKDIFR